MNACDDLEVLLSLRASGQADALDAVETARLDAHLALCAACKAELGLSTAALHLARLPQPTEAERRALRDLPGRALEALHSGDRRRGLARRALVAAAGVAVAAGLAAAVIAPALFKKAPQGVAVGSAEQAQQEAWQEPDLEALWNDAQVVDLESSGQSYGDGSDPAIAALEY